MVRLSPDYRAPRPAVNRRQAPSAGAVAGVEDEGFALLKVFLEFPLGGGVEVAQRDDADHDAVVDHRDVAVARAAHRSEEHTSELQSLMRISYAVFCLKKKKHTNQNTYIPCRCQKHN